MLLIIPSACLPACLPAACCCWLQLFFAKVLRSANEDEVKALFARYGRVVEVNLFRAFQVGCVTDSTAAAGCSCGSSRALGFAPCVCCNEVRQQR
jgi:hypothetical protein